MFSKPKRRANDVDVAPKPKRTRKTLQITLGSDFAGLETPRTALENTGFSVQQLFTCDSDANCRKMAAALYGDAERVYHDVQRKPLDQAPHVDLYVAGVCCQPWSSAGRGGGIRLSLPHPAPLYPPTHPHTIRSCM